MAHGGTRIRLHDETQVVVYFNLMSNINIFAHASPTNTSGKQNQAQSALLKSLTKTLTILDHHPFS